MLKLAAENVLPRRAALQLRIFNDPIGLRSMKAMHLGKKVLTTILGVIIYATVGPSENCIFSNDYKFHFFNLIELIVIMTLAEFLFSSNSLALEIAMVFSFVRIFLISLKDRKSSNSCNIEDFRKYKSSFVETIQFKAHFRSHDRLRVMLKSSTKDLVCDKAFMMLDQIIFQNKWSHIVVICINISVQWNHWSLSNFILLHCLIHPINASTMCLYRNKS